MKIEKLAIESLKNAYSPYSNVSVGSAVRMKDGKIFTGSNIENASYTPTICAERVAIFKAVSEGYRKGDFDEIAVAASWEGLASPCGVCRQVMREFFTEDTKIKIVNSNGTVLDTNINEILPLSFGQESLK